MTKKRTPARLAKIGVCFSVFIVSAEVSSWLYFKYALPLSLQQGILYAVGRSSSKPKTSSSSPKIKPYLWSNYEPNPGTRHANEYGWRYGGGPKKSSLRILCLGGSTTWGDGATEPRKSYPAQMETVLRERGYDLEVVNGGCPYYTTAEIIGTLAFRGIYEDPRIVLIHEGGNDTGPLMSPREYKADYSHWRTAGDRPDVSDRLALLHAVWRLPSWSVRLVSWFVLRPDPFGRAMLGRQLDSPQDALLSTHDVSQRYNTGYEKNLRTLAAISRAHGATPVFMTFNQPAGRMHFLVPQMKDDPVLAAQVDQRASWAMEQNNRIMQAVGKDLGVDVIRFDQWHPSRDDCWVDQCHLNDMGEKEKAEYVGGWLIEHGYLEEARTAIQRVEDGN
jgi:lysophospholipase L1-like esterase